jgi:hypothetical protein
MHSLPNNANVPTIQSTVHTVQNALQRHPTDKRKEKEETLKNKV